MNRIFAFAASAALALGSAPIALAHEHHVFKIGSGTYEFTVGSLNEPIVVDDKTGVDIRIKKLGEVMAEQGHRDETKAHAEGGTPVTGLEAALKVELIAGSARKTLDLSPAYNDPGAYRAPFFPTVQTTLTYRVFGTIDGVAVDLAFTCDPSGHPVSETDQTPLKLSDEVTRLEKRGVYGCPAAKSALGFPEASASLYETNARVGALEAAHADLGATSRNMGALGLVVGFLGLIAGAAAMGMILKKKGM